MKIGIVGFGKLSSLMRSEIISSLHEDVEIVDVTQDEFDEDKKKIAILGGMSVGGFLPVPPELPIENHIDNGKCTGRKSDRKRNKKNRWR